MRLSAQDGVGVAARLSFSANRSVGVKSELALYIDLPKEKREHRQHTAPAVGVFYYRTPTMYAQPMEMGISTRTVNL